MGGKGVLFGITEFGACFSRTVRVVKDMNPFWYPRTVRRLLQHQGAFKIAAIFLTAPPPGCGVVFVRGTPQMVAFLFLFT